MALKSNSTVVAWGSQRNVPAGLTNVTAISVGATHTVALVTGAPLVPSLNAQTTGQDLILSWPTNAVGFTLQCTLDLTPPATWMDSPGAAAVIGGQFTVTNTVLGNARFYRLKKF